MTSSRSTFYRYVSLWIVGLVFAVPLLLSTAVYDTYDLPKMSLVALADVILFCWWIKVGMDEGALRFRRSALDIPLLAFLGIGLVSTIFSIDPALSFWGSYRVYIFGWAPTFLFVLLYWLTVQAADPALARRVRWAALISGACVGVYAVLQYYGLELFSAIPSAEGARIWSSLGNPVYVGALCMMAFLLALSRWSFGSGVAFFLILGGLLISLSRSAWVGTCVGAGWFAWATRHQIRWPRMAILFGTVVVMAMALPGVTGRVRTIVSSQDASNASRIEGWKGGLRIWWAHPWLGTGPDTFFQAFRPYRTLKYIQVTGSAVTQGHAHNEFIQIAATQGMMSVLCYIWILVVLFKRLWRTAAIPDQDAMGFGAALLALCVQDQFNFSAVATSAWAAVFAGLLFSADKSEVKTITLPLNKRWGTAAALALAALGIWGIGIPLRADWNYKQGKAWSQGEQYTTALRYFREAVRLNGRVEVYVSDWANAARSCGLWDEAWRGADSSVRRHPFNPDAWNNRGVAAMWMIQLAHQDRWNEALISFQRAIALDPVFVDAWANVAKYQHLRGNLSEEKKLWQHVLELKPDDAMAKQVLGVQ